MRSKYYDPSFPVRRVCSPRAKMPVINNYNSQLLTPSGGREVDRKRKGQQISTTTKGSEEPN